MMFSTKEQAEQVATTLNDGEFDCLDNIDSSPAFEGIMAGDNSWEYHAEQRGDGKYEVVCYEPSFSREYGGRHMELTRIGVI